LVGLDSQNIIYGSILGYLQAVLTL